MKQILLILMASLILVTSGCKGASEETTNELTPLPTQGPITQEPPVAKKELATCTITEAPTEAPTEASTEVATESTTLCFNEVIIEPVPSVVIATAAPTQKPTAAPTQKPTAAPTQKPTAAPTQKPTAAPTQNPTAAPTENSTENKYRYGICTQDTEFEKDGRVYNLISGQKVCIINSDEEGYEIQWYDSTAHVESSVIECFPDDYVPNFASGQWAGAISKR